MLSRFGLIASARCCLLDSGDVAVNNILAKSFVFLNEVAAWLVIVLVLITCVYMAIQTDAYFMWAGIMVGSFVFLVLLFGFFAIFVQNHKLLKAIAEGMNKP